MKKRLFQVLAALFIVGISLIFVATSVFAAGQPTVTSSAATDIHNNWATLNGEVTVINDTNITDRGFVWDTSTHGDPGNVAPAASGYGANWTESGTFGLGTFSHVASPLIVGTTYYWRACALNDAGFWAYSGELSFATTTADRFWVGGTGNWNSTGEWSNTSGGASGASVPTSTTDVYFDANSFTAGGQVVTSTSSSDACHSMTWTGATNTPTFIINNNPGFSVYGDLTTISAMVFYTSVSNGQLTFKSTSGTHYITTNGLVFGAPSGANQYSPKMIFNGAGGTWQLMDDWHFQSTNYPTFIESAKFVILAGTFDMNNNDVGTSSHPRVFEMTGTTTRNITFGNGIFNAYTWTVSGSNMTVTPGTGTINFTSSLVPNDATFAGGGITTYPDLVMTPSNNQGNWNISGVNTFANFTLSGNTNKNFYLRVYNNQTITGTWSITGTGVTTRIGVTSDAYATQRTITAATVSSTYADYQSIIGAGAGSWDLSAGANNSIAYGNCTGITFTHPYDANEDLYWTGLQDGVAGSGTWDSSQAEGVGFFGGNEYNWSTTSGGAGGIPRHYPPLHTQSVHFDANSGFTAGNSTVSTTNGGATGPYCKDFDWTGSAAVVAPTFAISSSNNDIQIWGSMTLVSGMQFTNFISYGIFQMRGTGTITTNGATINTFGMNINTSGTITLADTLTISVHDGNESFRHTAGTFNANGQTIVLSNCVGAGLTFYGNNQTYYGLTMTGAGVYVISGADTFTNMTRQGTNVFTDGLQFTANQVISGTFTIAGYDGAHRLQFTSSVAGTQRQITVNGSNVVSNCDISDSACVGSASKDISAGNNSDLGNNLGWIFTPGSNVYWVGNTGNWSDITKWASSSGGIGGTGHIPLIQDTAVFDANSFAIPGRTVTIDITNLSGIDSSAVTNNPTITKAGQIDVYGNLSIGTCTFSPTSTYMKGQTNNTVQSNNLNAGLNLSTALYINKNATYMNSVSAAGNFSVGTITLLSGVFNINSYNVTGNTFVSTTTTFTRALNLSTGTFTLQDTGAVTKWDVDATNFSLFETSSTIVLTNSGASAQTFNGANLTYGNLTVGGAGNYQLTFTGSNTFRDLTIDRSLAAKTVRFTNGTTTNVTNFYCPQAGTTVVILTTTSVPNIWTLRDTAGSAVTDYMDIRYSVTTGGATFYAGPHSTVLDGVVQNNGGVMTGSPVNLYEGPPNTPTVTTVGNFNVILGNATLNGQAVSGPSVLVTGSPKTLNPGTTAITTTGTAPGTISITVTGSGWLLTGPTAPTVTTVPVTNLAYTSVTLNGDLTSFGGYGTVFGYFHYGTDPTLAVYSSTSPMSTLTGLGTYTYNLSGLASETTYYYQAYISDSFVDLASGTILSFVTTGNPDVLTLTPTGIGDTTATLQGTVTTMGLYSSVACFFQYGLTVSYGNNTPEQTITSATGFLQAITGLQSNTTYHYRAAIRYNVTHYVYGGDVTFSTIGAGQPGTNAPDILSIVDAKVVTGYLTPGDQMYLISYKAIYLAGTPAQPASEYFVIQVLNNSVVVGQWPLPQWGYQPVGLYLAPQSAPPYGGLYTIKIVGIPAKWPVPPIPEATRVLTAGDWLGADLTQLDNWVIQTATAIGNYYNETLLTYTATGTVLNSTGSALFNNNISGLSQVRPQLFSVFALRPTPKNTPITDTAYTDTWNPSTQLGPYINGLLQDGATATDMDPTTFNNLLGITIWLVITVLLLFGFKGSYLAALISAPVLVGVSYSGLLIPVVIVILAVLNVLLLLYALLPRGTG